MIDPTDRTNSIGSVAWLIRRDWTHLLRVTIFRETCKRRTARRSHEEQTEDAGSYGRCPVHGVVLVAEGAAGFLEWLSTWTLARVDAIPLVYAIEDSARIYLGMRIVAEASSDRSVQENLTRAHDQSRKLISALDQLDGNSRRFLAAIARREDPVVGRVMRSSN